MIMFFTPYFDKSHMCCAREFLAMEYLEQQRLSKLGNTEVKTHGLIIPVVCRGESYLPSMIRAGRQYYNFSHISSRQEGSKQTRDSYLG